MKLVLDYIIAAANLYGLVEIQKVLEIYNQQNEKQLSQKQMAEIVIEHEDYLESNYTFVIDDYFAHDAVLEFDDFDYYLDQSRGKPYYVPDKTEFLKYTNGHYFEKNNEYRKLVNFLADCFFEGDKSEGERICQDINFYCSFDFKPDSVLKFLSFKGLDFTAEQDLNKFLELLVDLANNTRIWENNGHTPEELFEQYEQEHLIPLPEKEFLFAEKEIGKKDGKGKGKEKGKEKKQQPVVKEDEPGRNEPCPCGSGKKYKKCCLD